MTFCTLDISLYFIHNKLIYNMYFYMFLKVISAILSKDKFFSIDISQQLISVAFIN